MEYLDRKRLVARQALDAWASFPADRAPRPLVVLGPAVLASGFPSSETKRAFMRGAVKAVPGFPPEVLRSLRRQAGHEAGPSLLVTAATPASAEFCTDRGRQLLPAWEVQAPGIAEPIWVLDPDIEQQAWRPAGAGGEVPWRGTQAVLDGDGCAVTMFFTGNQREFSQYADAEVLESGGAVAILPIRVSIAPTGLHAQVGHLRKVTVDLAVPLGNRVLLDASGSPVMVQTDPPA